MRRPGRDDQELARLEVHRVTREMGEICPRCEHGVQTVIEYRTETTSHFWRVEGPLLLPLHQIHPEVGTEGVNVKTAVSPGLQV